MSDIIDAHYTLTKTIMDTLHRYPALLGAAMEAIAVGMDQARQTAQDHHSATRDALWMALSLVHANRRSDNTTAALEKAILRVVHEPFAPAAVTNFVNNVKAKRSVKENHDE